jgi:hypothetical protein
MERWSFEASVWSPFRFWLWGKAGGLAGPPGIHSIDLEGALT